MAPMNPPSFSLSSLLVLLGGGFGAWLRYLTGLAWAQAIGPVAASAFPWATLTTNVAGSLAMGVLVGWLARHGTGAEPWHLLLGVGVLGGYTTFSSFALEFVLFVERGQLGLGGAYVGLSLAAGFAALMLGLYLMRCIG